MAYAVPTKPAHHARADSGSFPTFCIARDEPPFKLPDGWKADDPVPREKTNCVRCHLTAGRELTAPVKEFARSVHDFAKLSCNSCHGGNLKDDATAHENEHGFIGTKLSAHIAACSACHTGPAEQFQRSKHFWDLTKRINRDYPTCVDCHGNHDVGKPPPEFTLTNVCTDCHKDFDKDRPHTAAVVTENDRLWQVLRLVQKKNAKETDPIPEMFRKDVKECRAATAKLMHRAAIVTEAEAKELNTKVNNLRERLETWLKEQG
jgi:hypothetical protein